MDLDKIMKKARALLKLANRNPNEHEAATAAGLAQRLIEEYKLGAIAIDDAEEEAPTPLPDEPIKRHDDVDRLGKIVAWKADIFFALCNANGCKGYQIAASRKRGTKASLGCVGRESDVQTIRYLYDYLCKQVEIAVSNQCDGRDKMYRSSFRVGMALQIGHRLREAKHEAHASVERQAYATGGENAIVLVRERISDLAKRDLEVTAWQKQHLKLRAGKGSTAGYGSMSGRGAGRVAGSKVHLGSGRPLGTGSRGELKGQLNL